MYPVCESTNVKVNPGPDNTFGRWKKCQECGKIFKLK